jgi:hypothetical protein
VNDPAKLVLAVAIIRRGLDLNRRPGAIAFALAVSGLITDWEPQPFDDPYDIPFGDYDPSDAHDSEDT